MTRYIFLPGRWKEPGKAWLFEVFDEQVLIKLTFSRWEAASLWIKGATVKRRLVEVS